MSVELDTLRLILPDGVAASLYLLFMGPRTPQSLRRVGELLLPRVQLHIEAELAGVDDRALHISTDISSALGLRVQLPLLARCVVGMLLQLELALLYAALTQPPYLRSAVCESLHVLCSAALTSPASSYSADSALGFLLLHGSCDVHDDGAAAAPTGLQGSGPTPTEEQQGESVNEQQQLLHVSCDVHGNGAAAAPTGLQGSGPTPTDEQQGKSVSEQQQQVVESVQDQEAFMARLLRALRTKHAHRSPVLRSAIDSAVSAASPALPEASLYDGTAQLRLACSRLRIPDAKVDAACTLLLERRRHLSLAAAPSLPAPLVPAAPFLLSAPLDPPTPAVFFFVGGGSGSAMGNAQRAWVQSGAGPAGRYSTRSDHCAVDSASRRNELVQSEHLRVNAACFLFLTEQAKDEGYGECSTSSNMALAYAARTRRSANSIEWKGVAYAQRTLGVWRRVFCMWRARITGWFTSAEFVMYYATIVKIERGVEGALESMRALVQRTRYCNGRLPGCSRYTEAQIKSGYVWKATLGHCVHSRGLRAYGFPLDYYGFTASRHTPGSILRLHSIPLWCFFRHKAEARCMFGLRETATEAHRLAQRARIEERARHFCLYREGFALRYGPPVQLHKGCLPGAFTKGVSQAGLEVAGIDISSKSADFCREFRAANASTRVTFTLGDGLDDRVVDVALSKHPGLQHTGTFAAYACQPHTSVNQLRAGQWSEASGRTLNSALGVERRAYRLSGIPWMNESVVGSISSVSSSIKHVLITGFLTGEQSVDKHVIYYEDRCPPLLDEELLDHASWIANHSCGGMLRPFQHLGPDGVPTYMGERDPSDPSKYVHYVKPGGGWVNRRPWACCKGSAWVVFGNMPPGVTHADWCTATGNSADHIRDTQQLRNALWPRLGLLLGPQIHMYWMANKYGFPVIDFPDTKRDPRLLSWLRSILFCQGPWPRMPFQFYRLILTPVSNPGTIVVTQCGHLMGVHVPSRTSTLLDDLVTGLAHSFPQYSPDKKDLRFAGMLQMFSPHHLVFSSEVVDDDALFRIPEGSVASFASAPYEPSAHVPLVSVLISDYIAFLNMQARLGRYEWGVDLVIIRAHLHSELAAAQSLQVYAADDSHAAAQVRLAPGRYKSIPSSESALHLPHVYQSQIAAATDRPLVTTAAFKAHGFRFTRAQAARTQLSFEEQFEHLCPEPSVATAGAAGWTPQRSVANDDGTTTQVPCTVRVLTRDLARELMPNLVLHEEMAPRAVLPQDHIYNTRYATWASRYHAAAKRLGIEHDPESLKDSPDERSKPRIIFPVVQLVWCLPSHQGQVLLTSLGKRLIPFAERASRLTRGTLLAAKAERARLLSPFYGLVWQRAATPPVPPAPPPPAEPYQLRQWLAERRGDESASRHNRLRGPQAEQLRRFISSQLARNPSLLHINLRDGLLRRFGLSFVGPDHYVRVEAPGVKHTRSTWRHSELIFVAHLRARDRQHSSLPVTRGLEPVEESLLRSVDEWTSCSRSSACHTSPIRHVLAWMVAQGEPVLHISTVAWSFHAHVMDCLLGRRRLQPEDSRARTRELYLHQCIAGSAPKAYRATGMVALRVGEGDKQSGYDIRHQIHTVSVPRLVMSAAQAVPQSPDGSVHRRSLVDGTIYSCSLSLLAQHMALSGRRHLASLVEAVAAAEQATHPTLSATASLASAASSEATDFMVLLQTISSAWVSVGEHEANVLVACCSRSTAAVCQAVWSTHLDYSRTPYVDLACDCRVMAALHGRTKWVETRFLRGALHRVQPGFICKTWCPRPSVTIPASKFPCYSYIAGVVYERDFQRLYDRFGTGVLPGMPRDYVVDLQTHASSSPGKWHAQDVEQVYMSIYQAHHPTVESWRASQRRGARNVVAFILSPLPPGFIAPQGVPLNPRRQVLMDESRWTSDERVHHASVVVQCYARRYLRQRGYLSRVRAFRAMVHRTALLMGRDLVVPAGLLSTYAFAAVWARHSRPRFVGYVASLRLQVRWRSWLGPTSPPLAVKAASVHMHEEDNELDKRSQEPQLPRVPQDEASCIGAIEGGSQPRLGHIPSPVLQSMPCAPSAGDEASEPISPVASDETLGSGRLSLPRPHEEPSPGDILRHSTPAPNPSDDSSSSAHVSSILDSRTLRKTTVAEQRPFAQEVTLDRLQLPWRYDPHVGVIIASASDGGDGAFRYERAASGAVTVVPNPTPTTSEEMQRRVDATLQEVAALVSNATLLEAAAYEAEMTRIAFTTVHAIFRGALAEDARRTRRVQRLVFAWRLAGFLLVMLHASRRKALRKATRTGRSYLCIQDMSVRLAESPDTRLAAFPSAPEFCIDDLVQCAATALAPSRRRVWSASRDGSCLLHAFAAAMRHRALDRFTPSSSPSSDILRSRPLIVEWLAARMDEDPAFTMDVAVSVIANVSPHSQAAAAALSTAKDVSCGAEDLQPFVVAYGAYVLGDDTYCGEYEIMALACIWRVRIDVLRVGRGASDTLDGASLVTWLSVAHESTRNTAPVTLLYTNEHYDAVIRFRGWRLLRTCWAILRVFLVSRRRLIAEAVSGTVRPGVQETRFCRMARGRGPPKVLKSKLAFTVHDIEPHQHEMGYVHYLVIPYAFVRDCHSLQSYVGREALLADMIRQVASLKAAESPLSPDSEFLVGWHSEPSIARLHLHVIYPRSVIELLDRWRPPCFIELEPWCAAHAPTLLPTLRVASSPSVATALAVVEPTDLELSPDVSVQGDRVESSFVGGGSGRSGRSMVLESPQERRARTKAERAQTAPGRASVQAQEQHQLARIVETSAGEQESWDVREAMEQTAEQAAKDASLQEAAAQEEPLLPLVLQISAEEQAQVLDNRRCSAVTLIQLCFRGRAEVRHRAACKIQLGFLGFFARRCRQRQARSAAAPQRSTRIYTYDLQGPQIEEVFCSTCGNGGLIDEEGVCEVCFKTPYCTAQLVSATARLTYNVPAARS